jgi:LmbE family N-acetylglucosaminyl deacetylase
MGQSRRILFIHAHPDDIEILAGGTALLLSELGHRLTFVTMTAGDCGSKHLPAEEISRIRMAEAQRAAELAGARYACAGFKDLSIFNDDASRRRITALLRELRPEIVITASPEDYHSDHEATSTLVRDACFAAPAPNYQAGDTAALPAIPHLYFTDPIEGVNRNGQPVMPDFFVDVSPCFAGKRQMLAVHESQRQWLREHHGIDDYLEEMERWTGQRGALAGVRYAEGFRQYRCHPYPRDPLLQTLFKEVLTSKAHVAS